MVSINKIVFTAIAILTFFYTANADKKKKTLVLDAGHGGLDPGATMNGLNEKDVNLSIVLEIGKNLENDFNVLYTRKDDSYVGLVERNKLGRNHQCLFISIHCNSCKKKSVRGVEVYVMTTDLFSATSEVAKRENSVVLLDNKGLENLENFKREKKNDYIFFSLQQEHNYQLSLELANDVSQSLSKCLSTICRGVKQDNFYLFNRVHNVCILVEVGYLSNSAEAKKLSNSQEIKKIAKTISSSIRKFSKKIEASKTYI